LFKFEKYEIKGVIGNSDLCNVSFSFNNCFVSLSASRIANKKIRKIYVEERDRTTEGDFMTQEIYIYRKPTKYMTEDYTYKQENITEKVLVSKVEPLRIELKTFLECIKKNKEFPVSPSEGVFNLKICEEIKKLI